MPRNGAEGPFPPICVHSCVPTVARTILARRNSVHKCPETVAERPDPPICVHYCDPKATHNPSPRPNSVHKCPKTATRGHFGRSVYTPASPHGRSNDPREVQQCTQMPQNGAERPFPPICVHCCVAAGAVRPTSPGRRRNHLPTRTHEASVFGGKMSVKGKPRPVFAGQGCGFGRGGRI